MHIFDLCDCLDDDSIDMILCDLPYGITACEWDNVIPFDDMWECFKRVIKPRGAVVLTASQPFTSQLVMSNLEWFREEIIWLKSNGGMFLNANRQHLKRHENILLFADGLNIYNPQMTDGKPYRATRSAAGETTQDQTVAGWQTINDGLRYPLSYQYIASQTSHHPTQKPVALFEYLIRTYTQPGETVFDPCVGSGTTAIAARNTGRNYIVGDSSAEYIQVARDRLAKPYTLPLFDEQTTEQPKPEQMGLL
jgi:site-specific DNA-methyltransferase (adenine-specific)